MNKLVNKIKKINFYLILLITLIISYGQILGMYIWQDDNGLFFKLSHINESPGYFGPGPFGVGPYKYTATPYIPIYKMFGFSTLPYFFLNLGLYFLTAICVYKVFSKILGSRGGKIVGFLYAAGYIASDGFIRLFSSPLFSLSVVLISLLLLSYWNYYQQKKIQWYLLSILFFFLAVEFISARTHYLIGVVVLFEFIFLTFRKPIKSLIFSLFRLLPFLAIFYQYFLRYPDSRSGQVKVFILSLLKGDLQQLYSLVSSWSNLVFPDWLMERVLLIKINILWLGVPIAAVVITIFLLRENAKKKILIPLFVSVLGVWSLSAGAIFSTTLLNPGPRELFIAFFGGILIILFFAGYFALKSNKNLYLFLYLWALVNILAYSAYSPTVMFGSVNRYLVHSFLALTGVFGVLSTGIKNAFLKKVVTGLIIVWGLGNMLSAFIYQNKILAIRSNPPRKFYSQLKSFVPSIKKGDIFYFDVAADSRGYFGDAFSVASMPETTAMAWRYGVDRYDFYRVTEFEDLTETIQTKNIPMDNVYTFFYSDGELINTTNIVRDFLKHGGGSVVLEKRQEGTKGNDFTVDLEKPIESFVPMELEFSLIAQAEDPTNLNFSSVQNSTLGASKIAKDKNLRKLTFNYQEFKNDFYAKASVRTSSDYLKRIAQNLIDQDPDTAWQADRVLWGKEKKSSFIFDLKTSKEINRFVWINAFGNNTPIRYSLSVSSDGTNWKEVKSISSLKRIDTKQPQIVEFGSQRARFIMMTVFESLNKDSPGISEAWVVPTNLSGLNIDNAEEFLRRPFAYVSDSNSYQETLTGIGFKGEIKIAWQSDRDNGWISQTNSNINVIYDGRERNYKLLIPAGGTKITKIKFSDVQIPGRILLNKIRVKYLSLQGIKG
jgi:hypothetical protein